MGHQEDHDRGLIIATPAVLYGISMALIDYDSHLEGMKIHSSAENPPLLSIIAP